MLHRGTAGSTAGTDTLQASWPHTLVVGMSRWLHAVQGACPQANILPGGRSGHRSAAALSPSRSAMQLPGPWTAVHDC